MKKWLVCIDPYYVRDAQAYCGKECDDIHEDASAWIDVERPVFVGVYEAESEEEAIAKAHKDNHWLFEGALYVEMSLDAYLKK